jgi:DNA repair exonuclease SbcCD ATPase subunit
MFKLNTLTVKNFMSVGNQTQAVDFDRRDLTLVLGENLDQGGDDSGARNGTGKTTIINALSYALYGQALTNIKRDNLINKTNGKNMLVCVDFDLNGVHYRIERGRKPNLLKYQIGDVESEEQQGDSRETQHAIEKQLNMSHEMFKHLVALNTYTQPFLSLSANDQRDIIEQMLGITLLSEKAEKLKEENKQTKDLITEEEYRIKAIQEANEKIQEQIEAMERRQRLWSTKRNEEVEKLEQAINDLSHVNIEEEIKNHTELTKWNTAKSIQDQLQKDITQLDTQFGRAERDVNNAKKALEGWQDGVCHSCNQSITHLDSHKQHIADAEKEYNDASTLLGELQTTKKELVDKQETLPPTPTVFYDDVNEAHGHKSSLATLESQLQNKVSESDPYTEQIDDMRNAAVQEVNWDTINQLNRIREHQEFLLKLLTNKDSFIRKRIIDQNLSFLNTRLTYYLGCMGLPHTVRFMNDLGVEIQELGRDLDFDNLSRGERNRLILSLSWAFRDVWESLYHPINLLFIDEVIDSGMDASGVDSALGSLKKMSRDRNKSVWLVSHKDELAGRVNNILKVVKENGYTSYDTDIEVV